MHDPQNDPDFWIAEIRRVTTAEGDEMVVVNDQDGVTFVVDAEDFEQRRWVAARTISADAAFAEVGR